MRTKTGVKRGALTPEECERQAKMLIAERGLCLFIIDLVHSREGTPEEQEAKQRLLKAYANRANKLYAGYFPENTLSVGEERVEKGFSYFFGDSTWAGINSSDVIPLLVKLKNEEFPELSLHYGVAEDGWGEGMILIR